MSPSLLSTFLNGSQEYKIRELFIGVTTWDDDFDDALTKFIKNNKQVTKLEVSTTDHPSPDLTSRAPKLTRPSDELLDAIDSGHRRLEDVSIRDQNMYIESITGRRPMFSAPVLDPERCKRAHFLGNLNRQRRIISPLLVSLAEMECERNRSRNFAEALQAIENLDSLFVFLRRDEFGLLTILRRKQAVHGDTCALGSRKRSID